MHTEKKTHCICTSSSKGAKGRVRRGLRTSCMQKCTLIAIYLYSTWKIGCPKAFLSREYFVASSRALWASPTAPTATWSIHVCVCVYSDRYKRGGEEEGRGRKKEG